MNDDKKWYYGMVNKKLALVAVTVAVLLGIWFLPGCATKLEQGGAYAPGISVVQTNADGLVTTNFTATAQADAGLYVVDAAFDMAYSTLRLACKAERDNRELIWAVSPAVKKTFDKLRVEANKAVLAYAYARQAYLKTPTAPGLDTLQLVLSEVQRVAEAAQAALPAVVNAK